MEDANTTELVHQPSHGFRGQGNDVLTDHATARLARRAIRRRWPVTAEMRGAVLAEAFRMVQSGGKPGDVIAAMKILQDSDKINIAVTNLDAPLPQNQVNVGLAVNNNAGPTARDVAIELLKTPEGRAALTERIGG